MSNFISFFFLFIPHCANFVHRKIIFLDEVKNVLCIVVIWSRASPEN